MIKLPTNCDMSMRSTLVARLLLFCLTFRCSLLCLVIILLPGLNSLYKGIFFYYSTVIFITMAPFVIRKSKHFSQLVKEYVIKMRLHCTSWTIKILASCQWGPVTANGVDLLTEIYVIYMETHTSHRAIILPKIMWIGPLATAGEAVTHGRKARKYI